MTPSGKVGRFGEYTAQGFRFDSLKGEHAWWVSAWFDHGPGEELLGLARKRFMVCCSVFMAAQIITTYEEIKDISDDADDEGEVILQAVATWEGPTQAPL